ncbi:MAG: glycosyltransferase family 39 protein [Candidatus Omnitrophica bacterium]|nr:glycosyltransferase family 39 protein [Candidatus Omnitrophota bacterium]
MKKIQEKTFLAAAILAVLCAYLFFFKLGDMALTDPDETFYAQTAKEMLNKGDWTTPYLYGKPQFEKPIFIYWLVEASYKVFGINETAARVPSAVFGLIGVIAMYFLGSLLFGRKAGFLSALILATNVEYVILSRACITDMVLTVLMLLGVLFFFCGYLKEKRYFYILSSAAFALAVLTKGPIAIILPAAAFLIFLFLVKDLGRLKKIPLGWCLLVFILIAGPWYLAAYKIHGKEFIDAFFGFHNVTRFMQSEHKIGSQFYYNIPVIMAGFFPWSAFLPFGFWYMFKKIWKKGYGTQNEKNAGIFIMVWFAIIFVFFSISRTKLPTYIFPTFISLALIAGALWDDFLDPGKVSKFVASGVKASYYVLAAAIVGGAIGISIFVKFDMPEIFGGVVMSSLSLVIGFAVSAVLFIRKKYMAAFCLVIIALMMLLFPLDLYVLPDVERYEASKEVSGKLRPIIKDGEALGAQSNYLPGLAFYTDKFAVDLDKHDAVINFLNSDERIWAVIKEKNHRQLYDPEINSEYVKPTYLIYKVGKRSIVTNQVPEDGVYIMKRERAK